MKRLAASVFLGFLIPLVYAIIAFSLTRVITDPTIDRILVYPVRWPILIFNQIGYSMGYLPEIPETALIIWLIAGNVTVYSLMSYFLLWRLSKRKQRRIHLPPEPPPFTQH